MKQSTGTMILKVIAVANIVAGLAANTLGARLMALAWFVALILLYARERADGE